MADTWLGILYAHASTDVRLGYGFWQSIASSLLDMDAWIIGVGLEGPGWQVTQTLMVWLEVSSRDGRTLFLLFMVMIHDMRVPS